MRRVAFLIVATVLMALAGGDVCAQSPNGLIGGGSRFNPPPPPPPPGPDIVLAVIARSDSDDLSAVAQRAKAEAIHSVQAGAMDSFAPRATTIQTHFIALWGVY